MSDQEPAAIGPLLDEIFRGTPGLREPDAPEPDDGALVAYLSGALASDEAATVELGLTRRPGARRRLHAVAERLDSLQASPWSAVETADDGVGRAWCALASERLAASPIARSRWAIAGWEAVRAQAVAGATDAQAAWAVFLSFADQWGRMRRAPRFAEARGGGAASGANSLPPGVAVTLEADVMPNGALSARAWVRDDSGMPSNALDGQAAQLGLAAGADAWPLADAIVRDGQAAWDLKGAGWDLGLSPGPLPTGDLTVSFLPSPAPPDAARILMARGSGGADSLVEFHGQPRRNAGRLTLTLSLPAPTRMAHAGSRLAVSAAIAPGLRQRLGEWSVADWGDSARTIETPCPGPDGDFDLAALSWDLID